MGGFKMMRSSKNTEEIARLQAENARLREAAMPNWLKSLLERADAELTANAHKGDWNTWLPSPDQFVSEIIHHAEKIPDAESDEEAMEYLADLFNYIRKGWELVHHPIGDAHTRRAGVR